LPKLKLALKTGLLLWFLLWVGLPARAAGPPTQPWNLAIVVEHSAAMIRPWQGRKRSDVVEKALNLELRTLPLRISAAVWLAGFDRAEVIAGPSTSLELKEIDLKLPQAATVRADLLMAVEKAGGWLKKRGGGSLIVIAAQGPPKGFTLPSVLNSDRIFVHVLGLAPQDDAGTLAQLALAGGGAYFLAKEPGRVLTFLHRAVLTSLTPARLLVKAYDQTNQPLKFTYGLERSGALAFGRKGVTGRVQQCLPGVYDLVWPSPAPTAPAPPPAKISVAPTGLSEVPVGGKAKLKVAALDKDGREPGWRMRVARLSDGLVLEPSRHTPFELVLFSGSYLIKSLERPLAWTVALEAGQEKKLLVGPVGSLKVKLQGPKGPLRVRYDLEDLLAHRPGGTGYTNQVLRLKSGFYRLELEVPPGLKKEITISPAASLEIELPAAGGIMISRGRPGQRVEVLDLQGQMVDTGLVNRVLPLLPGKYLVRLAQVQGRERIVLVKGGALTTLEAGELAETRPVSPMPR
jgi:hypothetical protein